MILVWKIKKYVLKFEICAGIFILTAALRVFFLEVSVVSWLVGWLVN